MRFIRFMTVIGLLLLGASCENDGNYQRGYVISKVDLAGEAETSQDP